ncbi:MAG: hypothetical protein ACK462_07995, partial [Planctomyces sp.]
MSRISIDWSYATASYITLTPIVVRSSRKTMTGEYHSSGQLAAWMVRSCGGVMCTVPVEDGCATGRLSRVLVVVSSEGGSASRPGAGRGV